MKRITLLATFALAASAVFAAGAPDQRVAELLKSAEAHRSSGESERAAAMSVEAASVADATPAVAAMARNVAMNDYARWQAESKPSDALPELRLNALFSDHAVLQRDSMLPVWGHAKPMSYVTVGFDGQWQTTQANSVGYFIVYFPPHAAGGPYTMEVFADGASVTAKDIHVGEVWIAGGQSNMEMPLSGYPIPVPEEDLKALAAPRPVRMIKVGPNNAYRVNTEFSGQWMTDWKGNEKTWSAAAGFFAAALARKLDVPVGIVLCAYSGSRAEAWIPARTLDTLPGQAGKFASFQYTNRTSWIEADGKLVFSKTYGIAAPAYSQIIRAVEANPKFDLMQGNEGREKPGFDDAAWKRIPVPGDWRDSLGRANGIVWYRKSVQIPAAWAGKELKLALGAVDKQDVTFFNGVQVGATGKGFEHRYWGTPREYTVPANLVKDGEALIAVRALSFADGAGLIGPAESMKLTCPSVAGGEIALAGEWAAFMSRNIDAREGGSRVYRHWPGFLADSMLAAITPCAARGAIWYQGESNAHESALYRNLMETLIREWQGRFTARDFAFLQVLLAGYPGKGTAWAEIRQAQVEAAGATGTGFASATDRGHTCIHPPQKKDVGERLALRALTDVYGFTDVVSRGPEVASVRMSGEEIEVAFRHADGLRANGTAPLGFEVADKEKKFATAEARLENGRVLLKVPDSLKHPARYVRYAWENYPEKANVYNGAGLPAIPFMRMIEGTIIAATAKPVSEDPQHWWNKARAYRHNQKLNNLDAELVFIGDSITHYWEAEGREVWARHFSGTNGAAFHAIQFGYEGDETGNVLWRIRQGELDGLRPKNIVLLIGTNNFGHRANEAPEDVFLGIQAIVDELRLRQPQARVVLLPLFPRGKQENAAWRGGRETNKLLPRLCDGRQVVLLDFTAKLLDADGKVAQALLHDFLHPSPAGYALWADELIRFLRGR